MLWVLTTNRKRMPLDPQPRADGNIVFTGRRELDANGVEAEVVEYLSGGMFDGLDDRPRFVSHFASCPNAKEHRGGRA